MCRSLPLLLAPIVGLLEKPAVGLLCFQGAQAEVLSSSSLAQSAGLFLMTSYHNRTNAQSHRINRGELLRRLIAASDEIAVFLHIGR